MNRLLLLGIILFQGFWFMGCAAVIDVTTSEPIHVDPGKRTLGARIDDEQIETIALVNLKKASPMFADYNVNVTSYNAVVLLTGQVHSHEMRQLAGDTVNAINTVRQVHNELQIQGTVTALTSTNDAWLTTKIKTKLLGHGDIDSGRIKVITEDGTVFLMGLVSRITAEKAAEVARDTRGVQKVVKVFEYID